MSGTERPPLARERTSIAWARTALGATALGVLLIRFGLLRDSATEIAAGAAYCLVAIPLALTGRSRHHDSAHAAPLALPVATVALIAAGVLTLVAVVG